MRSLKSGFKHGVCSVLKPSSQSSGETLQLEIVQYLQDEVNELRAHERSQDVLIERLFQ